MPEDDSSSLSKYCIMINKYVTQWMSRCVLNIIPHDTKLIFRKCEKSNKKYLDLVLHREFNKICLKENLLPNYSDFKLYDAEARSEDFVLECRSKLIEREIQLQTDEINKVGTECESINRELQSKLSNVKYNC